MSKKYTDESVQNMLCGGV